MNGDFMSIVELVSSSEIRMKDSTYMNEVNMAELDKPYEAKENVEKRERSKVQKSEIIKAGYRYKKG